jgi:hypothetical protein
MKFRIVFWDVLPCRIIVDRRFRGKCCLHHQGVSEISSSQGGEYEVQNCLLGCTAVYSNRRPTFQRYVLPPSSGMRIRDVSFPLHLDTCCGTYYCGKYYYEDQ